jgi:hypothetical protein
LAYNPSAITEDIDVFASHAESPGGLRAQFEHFRDFPEDAEQNRESAMNKITTSVLVLGGDIYPALGGDFPGNFALTSTQALAANVTGVTVPFSRTLDSRRAAWFCDRSAVQILWEQY